MSLRTDPIILAERQARDQRALSGKPLSQSQLAAEHRKAAAREKECVVALMSARDAMPEGRQRDMLTSDIADSQAFIERRLAKAEELEPSQHRIAAE